MKRKFIISIFVFIFITIVTVNTVYAQTTASFSLLPTTVIQGDPLLIQIQGVMDISTIKKLTFLGKKLNIFTYEGKPSALIGIDLLQKAGTYILSADFTDGTNIKQNVVIGKRTKVDEPMGIPDKLGGNTKASQDTLVTSLVAEKDIMSAIRTSAKALWTKNFLPPLQKIFVTDPYGYSRQTGEYSIAHKGTDYRAPTGTNVMAINRGVVRVAQSYRDYGNTVVIDHGMGLMSFYLHLSKIKVKVGNVVDQGQVIGLSGDTGYAVGAHLHLGIHINNIAIDPEKFFEIFSTN